MRSLQLIFNRGRAVRQRVNAPVTFGVHELARVMPDYLAAHTEVSVDLTAADRTVDLIDEGYDVVFRTGPLADSGLIAKSLRPMGFTICAAPAYIAARGSPGKPLELREHECLGFAYGTTRDRRSFIDQGGVDVIDVSCRLVGNDGQALLTAALAGLGILLQPAALVRDAIEEGRLVRFVDRLRNPQPSHAYSLRP